MTTNVVDAVAVAGMTTVVLVVIMIVLVLLTGLARATR